jgi:hypothetical protein
VLNVIFRLIVGQFRTTLQNSLDGHNASDSARITELVNINKRYSYENIYDRPSLNLDIPLKAAA